MAMPALITHDLLSSRELLALYASLLDALRSRGVLRSSNNPVADYAEGVCARAMGWTLAGKSTAGYDATDAEGRKFEIKARRIVAENGSRQLSAIRAIERQRFDFLAAVLFDREFAITRAALIPFAIVKAHSKLSAHTNSWRFILREGVWSLPGVEDITDRLRAAE